MDNNKKVTLGGDRLGAGKDNEIFMHDFERSTHDLSYMWRSSMSAGTLVPFMNELGLSGDTFEINLDTDIKTLPTIGPLFGSYKVQLDVFEVPLRLYHKKLMNNTLNIGLDMENIKFPKFPLRWRYDQGDDLVVKNQVNQSSLYAYLGARGVGINQNAYERYFNGVPLLGYFDIFKNYYANKQEEEAYVIHYKAEANPDWELILFDDSPIGSGVTSTFDNDTNMGFETTSVYGEDVDTDEMLILIREDGLTTRYSLRRLKDVFEGVYLNEGTGYISVDANKPYDVFKDRTWNVKLINEEIPLVGNNYDKPYLTKFDLTDIDDMRERIFSDNGDGDFDISDESGLWAKIGIEGDTGKFSQQGTQEMLAVKCYQSDLLNNWMRTDFFEGSTGINEITSVDTSGDSFTIDSLNMANKVYNMLNRIAVTGGSYDDWLDAVYSHERKRGKSTPVYHGSLIKELTFQEVIANSKAEDQPLGELAGRGMMTKKNKGGRIKIKCDEPCYIMGIISLTPRVTYSQGNDWKMNLRNMAELHVPNLDEIGFQDLVTDQMVGSVTNVGNGDPNYESVGRQPAWINYMTNIDRNYGNFADENREMFMVLDRRYEIDVNEDISDITTYIDPSKFNNIFADTRLDAQNFWTQIKCDIKARRKMSAKVIPNL